LFFDCGEVFPFQKEKVGIRNMELAAWALGGYVKIAGLIDESMDTEVKIEARPQPWGVP